MANCCSPYFFLCEQQFIHMANGLYQYLMEYTSKTYCNNNVQEKSNKTSDKDVSAEEDGGSEEEQGN